MHKTYKTRGTCSTQIDFDVEDHKIHNLVLPLQPNFWK